MKLSFSRVLIVLGALTTAILGLSVVLIVLLVNLTSSHSHIDMLFSSSSEDIVKEMREVWAYANHNKEVNVDPAFKDEAFNTVIQDRFYSFVKALDRGDADFTEKYFNPTPLINYSLQASQLVNSTVNREDFRQNHVESFEENFDDDSFFVHGQDLQILAIKRSHEHVAIVYTQQFKDDYDSEIIRWHLTDLDGTWKIYDYCDIGAGTRRSTFMRNLLTHYAENPATHDAFLESLDCIVSAMNQLASMSHDADTSSQVATSLKRKLLRVKFPPKYKSLIAKKRLAIALCDFWLGNQKSSYVALNKTLEYNPNLIICNNLKATICINREQYKQAMQNLDIYSAVQGPEADTFYNYGFCHLNLDNKTKALDYFRKCLDVKNDHVDALIYYAQLTNDKPKNDLVLRIRQINNCQKLFSHIAETAISSENYEALSALAKAYREISPSNINTLYYSGYDALIKEDHELGCQFFDKALKVAKDDDIEICRLRYTQAMARAGHGLVAYQKAADLKDAYKIISKKMWQNTSLDELEELTAEHMKKYPDDPNAIYYKSLLLIAEKNYYLSAEILKPQLDKKLEKELFSQCLTAYLFCKYKIKDWEGDFVWWSGREDAFDEIANDLLNDKDCQGLEKLLIKFGKDQSLNNRRYWKAELLASQEKWKELLIFLNTQCVKIGESHLQPRLVRLYVVACLHLKRVQQARDYINRRKDVVDLRYYDFLISVFQGNVDHAIQAYKLIADEYDYASCLNDDLIADILSSDKFEPFRDAYSRLLRNR